MDDYERAVLAGQAPEWRELWEERLGRADRRRISRAVRRGEALAEPFEAALAAGRAHQWRRAIRFRLVTFFPLTLVLLGPWLYLHCLYEGRVAFWCELYVVLAGAAVIGVPLVSVRMLRGLGTGEDRNRRVYAAAIDDRTE